MVMTMIMTTMVATADAGVDDDGDEHHQFHHHPYHRTRHEFFFVGLQYCSCGRSCASPCLRGLRLAASLC